MSHHSKARSNVASMFNQIAPKYDLLNHLLSWGIDKRWRKRTIDKLIDSGAKHILDVATGTGDLAIAAAKRNNRFEIIGVDISAGMLEAGRVKVVHEGLDTRIKLLEGDSLCLPFNDQHFDATMVAFGVRNFEDTIKGLSEMCRVTSTGGIILVLEFSKPDKWFMPLYSFYSKWIMPLIGRLVSKHSTAYTYLPETALAFAQGKDFCDLLVKAGYSDPQYKRFTFGIATLYSAVKR